MYILTIVSLVVCCQIFNVVTSKDPKCSDPNAELRSDSPECVVTCNKRSILENPASCFENHTLIEDCYCKQDYYLDETTKKCVNFQNCSYNSTNNELSRFNNECGNNCETFHTLTPCPNLLRGQSWCHSEFCKVANGTCVSKEQFYGI